AKAQLAGGILGHDLRLRVEQLQMNVRMLAELERIRLEQSAVVDDHFDFVGADRTYGQAFSEYGIDVEALTTAEVGGRVRGSAIRTQLVAGLDNWAHACALARKGELSQKGGQLLAVARLVDPDAWRNRLRDMVLSRDPAELEQLARSAPVKELPIATLSLLGSQALATKQSGPLFIELLRGAQQRFPSDFWINEYLGWALSNARPPRLEEAVGFFRIAVALRPQSPGARVNLGNALQRKGDEEGAISETREA